MKTVIDALRGTGIPTFAGIWRATSTSNVQPAQYLVYTTLTLEDEHIDDTLTRYKHFIYLNLWSMGDVTDAVQTVRAAMRGAGFEMDEERTDFDELTKLFGVHWTWVGWEVA